MIDLTIVLGLLGGGTAVVLLGWLCIYEVEDWLNDYPWRDP